MATQPDSRVLKAVEAGQEPLLLAKSPRVPDVEEVSLTSIARKRDFLAAINYCIEVSGLDNKEVGMALGIDAGHFSNIRAGKSGCNFPTNKLGDLMTLCGNEIPLVWLAHKRGKGLVMLESETQRQLRLLREELLEERKKNEVLVKAIHGRAA